MTQGYVNGFFSKCAELGASIDDASVLCKIAIDDDFRNGQRNMALDFAKNNKYLGDITRYLPNDGFADGNRQGWLLTRALGSIFSGSHARERKERASYAEGLRSAGENWMKAQLAGAATPEERLKLRERLDQFNSHIDTALAANEHGNGLSNEERDFYLYDGGGLKRRSAPAAANAAPRDMYRELMDGRRSLPMFYNHLFNGETGEFYRKDGKELDPNAVLWNQRMRESRKAVADYKAAPKPEPAPAKPWDAPYSAPVARRQFGQ